MKSDFQIRFTAGLLILLTTAAVVLGVINFQKERDYQVLYDGIWCLENNGTLSVERIDPNGPGALIGIQVGDQLTAINHREVKSTAARVRQLYQAQRWSKATYTFVRGGIPFDAVIVLAPYDKSMNQWLRVIAVIYLGIGLYVLLRRWTAPSSTHFYIFCLTSFILYSFHYTGKLNPFDWSILYCNIVAGLLQAALFLHFVLVFPEKLEIVGKHRWIFPLLYVPGAMLFSLRLLAFRAAHPSENLLWNLDRFDIGHQALFFVAAASVLWFSYRRAVNPVLRQQLKWVTRGTILAFAPYTLFYVLPYLKGDLPTVAMKISVLSLGILPLTFGYAIFRYRLMDVDLIFKRGMVYFLAAAAIVGMYFAVVAGIVELVRTHVPSFGSAGQILTIVVTALLFDPVRKWIQEHIDQFFYRTRYDYRRTLIEFGRELSAETDLNKMLDSVENRLARTLLVDRLAIFLAGANPDQPLSLAKSFGISQTGTLDLSFLSAPRPEMEESHLFLKTRTWSRVSRTVRNRPLPSWI